MTFNAGRLPVTITVCRVLGGAALDWSALGWSALGWPELVCAYALAATSMLTNRADATLRIAMNIGILSIRSPHGGAAHRIDRLAVLADRRIEGPLRRHHNASRELLPAY
jgi:hypothetical protein